MSLISGLDPQHRRLGQILDRTNRAPVNPTVENSHPVIGHKHLRIGFSFCSGCRLRRPEFVEAGGRIMKQGRR